MFSNLSQKEKLLLEDQKSHEELCIKKYNDYANKADDPQLKQMFTSHGAMEQEHLNTINQILSGQIPPLPSGQGGQNQQSSSHGQGNMTAGKASQKDEILCKDLLMAEKYVSSTYDTTIFEFRDSNIRQILNHIQKEEQQHGEHIFNYMQSKGMYNIQ